MLDQVLGAHEPADAPAGGVEVLAGGADGDGEALDLGRERGDAGKGHVVQAVVDLVRQDDDLVLDAQVPDLLQLLLGVDLADGVVFWESFLLAVGMAYMSGRDTYVGC